jgi:hypothetical protein
MLNAPRASEYSEEAIFDDGKCATATGGRLPSNGRVVFGHGKKVRYRYEEYWTELPGRAVFCSRSCNSN